MTISSSKNEIRNYTEKISLRSDQTGTYAATAGWNNVGVGYAITIPVSGRYIIKTLAPVNVNAGDGRIAIGIDGTPIIYTSQRVYQPVGVEYYVPISLETDPIYLTTGQVATMMMKENSGVIGLGYTAADYGGYISAELVEELVSVRYLANDYSLSAIDTGKRWIDGKKIYKKVWTGTTASASSMTLALGITIDSVTAPMSFHVDSSANGWIGPEGTTNILVYFTNTTKNNVTFYINSSNFWARSYRLTIEYTV